MGDQSLLTREQRQRIKRIAEPVALLLGRTGLTPNALTLVGFAITLVAAVLLALGWWAAGGLVVLFGGVFDMFDGTLARATGRVSRLGGFMDSTFDRWGEAVVFVGIVGGCAAVRFDLGAILAAATMASAFLVSYTRARAESLGFHGEVGVAPRAERLVILTAALIMSGLAGGPAPIAPSVTAGTIWLSLGLLILFILATVTVVQRILHVRAQALAAEAKENQS